MHIAHCITSDCFRSYRLICLYFNCIFAGMYIHVHRLLVTRLLYQKQIYIRDDSLNEH